MRHGVRDGWNDPAAEPTETKMFAKTLVLALVLTGTALTFIGNVSAAPARGSWQPVPNYMQERSDPTNTNGNG
jgi:hypothetical protein